MAASTSRQRFHEYRQELDERRRGGQPPGRFHSDQPDAESPARQRGFGELLGCFWREIGEHRSKVLFALATLTVSTLLALIPGRNKWRSTALTSLPLEMPSWLASRFGHWSRMELPGHSPGSSRRDLAADGRACLGAGMPPRRSTWCKPICGAACLNILSACHCIASSAQSGGATSLIRETPGTADLIFNML